MARTSFLYLVDLALRGLVYTKFGSFLSINTLNSDPTECVNKGVVLASRGVAQREVAEKQGQINLNFINIWRTGEDFAWDRNKTTVSRLGMSIQGPTAGQSTVVKAVPVDLVYSMWCWSRDLDALNNCVEEFMFWRHRFPKLSMSLEGTYPLEFDLHFGASIDESPYDDKYRIGPYFIKQFPVRVDAWAFDVTDLSDVIKKIVVTCYDSLNIATETTVYVHDGSYDTELAEATKMFESKLFAIDAVNVAAHSVSMHGNFTADFTAGTAVRYENSTGNNGPYTVQSSSYANDQTTVVFNEVLSDSTVDGDLYIP